MSGLVAFVSGLLFALGLGVGGMTQPSKVLAFLDVAGDWDPSLAFVLGGALLVYFLVGRVALAWPRPLFDDTFHVPTRRDVDGRLVLGSVLFGAGWGLAGYCPGPALVSLASGRATVFVFVAAMLAGMWIFQRWNARTPAAATLRPATAASLVALSVLAGAQSGDGAPPGVSAGMREQMLVDGGWLASRVDQPGLVVLHVGKSREAYDRAHVPGARFVAFGGVAKSRGPIPNEMPSAGELTALARRLGITGEPDERIVIYGEDEGLLAARVFVALDALGLAGNAALLDGQWAGWQAEGRPVTTEVPAVAASSVAPRPRPERIASLAAVADLARRATGSPDAPVALVDARPRAQCDGSEAGDGVPRPGHVAGAVSAFWKEDLQSGGVPRLRPADELRALRGARRRAGRRGGRVLPDRRAGVVHLSTTAGAHCACDGASRPVLVAPRRVRRIEVPSVNAAFLLKLSLSGTFVASVLYVHFRGRERLSFQRQLTDHSTFLAPLNVLLYFFSNVPARPILDVKDFPELAPLRENWTTIRDEARRLYEAGHVRASERYDDLGFNSFFRKGWKRFYLKWYGAPLPSARDLCPKTVELVESIPSIHGAMFTLIEPKGKVGGHRDPFAGSVRYHLGLITPNHDDCCIWIDGERYSWRDGEDLLFDETYLHRFQNMTDQPRIIFFADVERPIGNPVVRGLNRWLIRHAVGLTATKNVEGEKIGFANKVFGVVYRIRLPLKRLKQANRTAYYALKYGALAAALYALLFAGSGVLR